MRCFIMDEGSVFFLRAHALLPACLSAKGDLLTDKVPKKTPLREVDMLHMHVDCGRRMQREGRF